MRFRDLICKTLYLYVLQSEGGGLLAKYDILIDAIFGFSFSGQPRSPFDGILKVDRPSPPGVGDDVIDHTA